MRIKPPRTNTHELNARMNFMIFGSSLVPRPFTCAVYAGRKKGPGDYNCLHMCVKIFEISRKPLYSFGYLPPCASEQGNVIGLVSVYIYICVCTIFFCN